MTATPHTRAACVQALLDAGLPLEPPRTGVRYSHKELLAIKEHADAGQDYDIWRDYRRTVSTSAVARRRDEAAD